MDEEKYYHTQKKVHEHLSNRMKATRDHQRDREQAEEEDDIHLAAVRASRGIPDPTSSATAGGGGAGRQGPLPPAPVFNNAGTRQKGHAEQVKEEETAGGTVGSLKVAGSADPFDQQLQKMFHAIYDRSQSSGGRVVSFNLIRADGELKEIYDDLLLYPGLPLSLRSEEEREMMALEEKELGGDTNSAAAKEALDMATKLAHLDEVAYSHSEFLQFVTKMHLACIQLDAVAVKWDTINTVKCLHNSWMMPRVSFKNNKGLVADGSIGQPQLSDTFPTSEHEAFQHSTAAPMSADVWSHVGAFLPMQDLLSLPLVSQFHFNHRETTVWATLYHKCFGKPTSEIEDDQYRERYIEVFKSLGDTTSKEAPNQQDYLSQFTLTSKGTLPMVYDPTLISEKTGKKKITNDTKKKSSEGATDNALMDNQAVKDATNKKAKKAEERAADLARLAPKLLLTGSAPICAVQMAAKGADFFKLETMEVKDPRNPPHNMLLVLLTAEKGGEASRRFARRIKWEEGWSVNKVASAHSS